MDITPTAATLRELLGANKPVVIPTFQRGYEWEKDQVEEFWDAVIMTVEGDPVFFGPMVTVVGERADEIELVDGQQRLTTVVLTLALLRDWVEEQDKQVLDEGTPDHLHVGQELRRELFFLNDNRPNPSRPRFQAAERIRAIFRDRVIADPKDGSSGQARPPLSERGMKMTGRQKEETKDLRRAKTIIKKAISAFLDGTNEVPTQFKSTDQRLRAVLQLRRALLDEFHVFTLHLSSQDDAYILFESLNNRGLRLSPADILRTISLRGVRESNPGDQSVLDASVGRWNSIGESLDGHDINAFLRHFLLAVQGERVQKKSIVSLFRSRLESAGHEGQVRALDTAADLYRVLLSPERHPDGVMARSIAGLRILNETHRVALLGALMDNSDPSPVEAQLQRRFFRSIEYLTYRWLLVGGNAQELESKYQEILFEMRGATDQATKPLNLELGARKAVEAAPSDKALGGLSVGERYVNFKYVIFRIEAASVGSLPSHWNGKQELEHLAPQTPTQYWISCVGPTESPNDELSYGEIVSHWGNLAMLESGLNKSIKNRDWLVKVSGTKRADGTQQYAGLSASQFRSTQDVARSSAWTRDDILDRTQWLANLGLSFVSRDWVETGQDPSVAARTWSRG